MNQDFLYNVVMAGCACTVGEMIAMLTCVFLNEIVSGVGVLSWAANSMRRRCTAVVNSRGGHVHY